MQRQRKRTRTIRETSTTVEEVPSSSASSVAPSAAPTLAAAKTAASIQEINDEQEPGWIFGVM